MKQHGFVLPSPLMLMSAALGLALLAAFVQTVRLSAEKKEFATFVTVTKTLGELQETKTRELEAKHAQLKKDADNENTISRSKLADAAKRLRDNRTRVGYLPGPSSPTSSPTIASFDRTLLERALSEFDGEVTGSILEGDQALIDLNTGKAWAKALR